MGSSVMTYASKFPRRGRSHLRATAEVVDGPSPFAAEDIDDHGMVPIAAPVREVVLEIMLKFLERTPAIEMGRA